MYVYATFLIQFTQRLNALTCYSVPITPNPWPCCKTRFPSGQLALANNSPQTVVPQMTSQAIDPAYMHRKRCISCVITLHCATAIFHDSCQ